MNGPGKPSGGGAKGALPAEEARIDRGALQRDLRRIPDEHRERFVELTRTLDAFEELATLATDANRGVVRAQSEFEDLLAHLGSCEEIPKRPVSFTRLALASGQLGSPPHRLPTAGQLLLPCFLPPFLFGELMTALLRAIVRRSQPEEPVADDTLWSGIWMVFSLAQQLRPLEMLFQAGRRLEMGRLELVRFRRIAAIAAGHCGSAVQPTSGSFPIPLIGNGPSFIDLCRLEQWNETERAVSCFCSESYRIDGVSNCTDESVPGPSACVGECIDIRGSGFGNHRDWGIDDRMSDVLFPTADGTLVAATTYLPIPAEMDQPAVPSGWSETRVRVVVPPAAVPGDLEMSILCRTNPGGRIIDPARCRFPRRWRAPTSEPYLEAIGIPEITFTVDATGASVEVGDAAATMSAEACEAISFSITARHVDSVILTDETDAEIPLVDLDPARTAFRAGLVRSDAVDKVFRLTLNSPCIETPIIRQITVTRFHAVTLEPSSLVLNAGNSGGLTARVSCPLEEDGVVAIEADVGWTGLAIPEPAELPISGGSDRSSVLPITTSVERCGIVTLRGRLTAGSSIVHRTGMATVEVRPVDVDVVATVRIDALIRPTFTGVRDIFRRNVGTFPATYSADRTSMTVRFPAVLSIDFVSVRPTPSTINAVYDGSTGDMSLTLSAAIGISIPFVDGGNVTIALDTRSDLRSEFGPFAPVGSRTRASGTGDMILFQTQLVGAGTILGGTADGRRLAVGLQLESLIRPPRLCGEEPWFPGL